jgi:hypothetical protein
MYTVRTRKLLDITVLGEQGDGRNRFAIEHSLQVAGQGKTGPLHLGCRLFAAQFRVLYEPLDSGLHGTKDKGRSAQAHHLECAHSLMQLLPCDPQLAAVNRGQIRTAGQVSITDKAPQSFGSAIEGLSKFVQNPGQRAQIIDRQIDFGFCCHCSPLSCVDGDHRGAGYAGPMVTPPGGGSAEGASGVGHIRRS